MRSRSVMVLMMATMTRRSPAAGARVARMREHSSSIDTSMPLTLKSSRAHRDAQVAVAFDERGDGIGELLLDHAAHGQHLVAHALQVFVEAARDVVGKIGGFHDDPQERSADGTRSLLVRDDAHHDIRRWRATRRSSTRSCGK